jgi:hypothetical protein
MVRTPGLLDEVVERLSEAGLRARLSAHTGAAEDAADLVIGVGDREHIVAVKVRSTLSAASVGVVLARLARHGRENVLLVTEYVNPQMAERLRRDDVFFADAAGNAYYSAPGVLIWVTGRRPSQPSRPRHRPTLAFQASGLRVMLGFLAEPSLVDETYRMIAREAGVSVGTVHGVFRDLEQAGYIVEHHDRRRLVEPGRLLDAWTEHYTELLHPKLELGRYRSHRPDWWRTATPLAHGVLWGGETAGALLTGHLRPEITTVYAAALPKELMIAERLRRDAEGDVEIRHRFWQGDLAAPSPDVVPAPLIYADLIAVGDSRCAEIAELVRGRWPPNP